MFIFGEASAGVNRVTGALSPRDDSYKKRCDLADSIQEPGAVCYGALPMWQKTDELRVLAVCCLLVACAPGKTLVRKDGDAAKPESKTIVAASLKSAGCTETPDPKLTTEDDKTLYAVGLMLGRNLSKFTPTFNELAIIQKGLADQVKNNPRAVDLETYGPKINALGKQRASVQAAAEKKKAESFIENVAKEPGFEQLPSGLVYKSLEPGTGDSPHPTDTVKVHYRGTLIDGTEFDSSFKRNQPAEFPVNGVIPCWTESLQKMKVGGKAKVICRSSIAYGDPGRPPTIPPGAALQFVIELLEIVAVHKP
jgi:FKBP-type peptidyl-prolyl cis-trans isomerase FkpA